MTDPTGFEMKDPPAQPDGATAETNAALGKAIERLRSDPYEQAGALDWSGEAPCAGGTDEARERALADARESYPCSFDEVNWLRGYDVARARFERKVAELERELAQWKETANKCALQSVEREARVRELEGTETALAAAHDALRSLEHAYCIEGDYTGEKPPLALAFDRTADAAISFRDRLTLTEATLATEIDRLRTELEACKCLVANKNWATIYAELDRKHLNADGLRMQRDSCIKRLTAVTLVVDAWRAAAGPKSIHAILTQLEAALRGVPAEG